MELLNALLNVKFRVINTFCRHTSSNTRPFPREGWTLSIASITSLLFAYLLRWNATLTWSLYSRRPTRLSRGDTTNEFTISFTEFFILIKSSGSTLREPSKAITTFVPTLGTMIKTAAISVHVSAQWISLVGVKKCCFVLKNGDSVLEKTATPF